MIPEFGDGSHLRSLHFNQNDLEDRCILARAKSYSRPCAVYSSLYVFDMWNTLLWYSSAFDLHQKSVYPYMYSSVPNNPFSTSCFLLYSIQEKMDRAASVLQETSLLHIEKNLKVHLSFSRILERTFSATRRCHLEVERQLLRRIMEVCRCHLSKKRCCKFWRIILWIALLSSIKNGRFS